MSVLVSDKVWKTELPSPTIKLVAMKLADHADDFGGSIFPSVQTICRQTNLSESSVHRSISVLLKMGLLITVKKGGKGQEDATVYRFDMDVLDRLYQHARAKWAAEDAAAKAKAEHDRKVYWASKGATLAPLTGGTSVASKGVTVTSKGVTVTLKGATVAPEPSYNHQEPSVVNKTRQQQVGSPGKPKTNFAAYLSAEAGETLIPFSSTDPLTLIAAGKAAERERLGIPEGGSDRLPFTRDVLSKIFRLGVNQQALIDKYHAKTKGKRIKDPSGYLYRMAQDAAAKRDGVSIEEAEAIASKDLEIRAHAMAEAVGAKPEPRKWKGARHREGALAPRSALRDALDRREGQ